MANAQKWHWTFGVIGFGLAIFPASLLAGTEVQFARADLDAFVTLVKPAETSIRLDGRAGEFRPGPSLRFAGFEPQDFTINLNLGENLLDLKFNDLRARAPTLTFEADRIRLEIAFSDQAKAIHSALGSISLKGVVLVAWIRFAADGSAQVTYDDGAIEGELKGSGLLRPRWVINALRKIALKTLKAQVERALNRPAVQASIEKGLVMWARFSGDDRYTRITPGSVKVSDAGIHFEAE